MNVNDRALGGYSSSSSDDDDDDDDATTAERQECVYELLEHRVLLRQVEGREAAFRQVVDELTAIFCNESVWIGCSKKFQSAVADSTAAAIATAAVGVQLGLVGRCIRSVALNKQLQKKHKTALSNAYRDKCILTSRAAKRANKRGTDRTEPEYLPHELWHLIFSNLRSPIDLARCRCVCVEWRDVIDSYGDLLWPPLIAATFGIGRENPKNPMETMETMETMNDLLEATGRPSTFLDPWRRRRVIVKGTAGSGLYFVRQLSESSFERLFSLADGRPLYQRRCFLTPDDVAMYVSQPTQATLRRLAALHAAVVSAGMHG